LDSQALRRETLCLNLGKQAIKHEQYSNWFKLNHNERETRQPRNPFCPVIANMVSHFNNFRFPSITAYLEEGKNQLLYNILEDITNIHTGRI
jgi:hypothetical protein